MGAPLAPRVWLKRAVAQDDPGEGTGDNRFYLASQALGEVFILEPQWADLHITEGLTYRCGEWTDSWSEECRIESCT
jgi:hypothetical protein